MGNCVSSQSEWINTFKHKPLEKCSEIQEDDHPLVKWSEDHNGNPSRKLQAIHVYKNPRIHITVNKAEQVTIGDKNQSKHINLQEQRRSKSQSSSGSNSIDESVLISEEGGSGKGLSTSHLDITDLKFETASTTTQDTENVEEDKINIDMIEYQQLPENLESLTKLICSCLQQLKSEKILQTDKKKLLQELKKLQADLDKTISSIEAQYLSQKQIPKIPKRLKNISQHHPAHHNDYVIA